MPGFSDEVIGETTTLEMTLTRYMDALEHFVEFAREAEKALKQSYDEHVLVKVADANKLIATAAGLTLRATLALAAGGHERITFESIDEHTPPRVVRFISEVVLDGKRIASLDGAPYTAHIGNITEKQTAGWLVIRALNRAIAQSTERKDDASRSVYNDLQTARPQ